MYVQSITKTSYKQILKCISKYNKRINSVYTIYRNKYLATSFVILDIHPTLMKQHILGTKLGQGQIIETFVHWLKFIGVLMDSHNHETHANKTDKTLKHIEALWCLIIENHPGTRHPGGDPQDSGPRGNPRFLYSNHMCSVFVHCLSV